MLLRLIGSGGENDSLFSLRYCFYLNGITNHKSFCNVVYTITFVIDIASLNVTSKLFPSDEKQPNEALGSLF